MKDAGQEVPTTIIRVPVDSDSSVGGSYPVAWCDLSEAWVDGGKFKAPITYAPEGWDRDCITRIYPRIAPEGDWDPGPTFDDHGELYVPPHTTVNGRRVLKTVPVMDDGEPVWMIYLAALPTESAVNTSLPAPEERE